MLPLVTNAVLISVATPWTVRRLAGRRRTRAVMAAAGLWAAWALVRDVDTTYAISGTAIREGDSGGPVFIPSSGGTIRMVGINLGV